MAHRRIATYVNKDKGDISVVLRINAIFYFYNWFVFITNNKEDAMDNQDSQG